MPFSSSGTTTERHAPPHSTPADPTAACLTTGVSKLTNSARMNIVNTVTKGFMQFEKDLKAHLLENLANYQNGGASDHEKCSQEVESLKQELEEKNRIIEELQEQLRNKNAADAVSSEKNTAKAVTTSPRSSTKPPGAEIVQTTVSRPSSPTPNASKNELLITPRSENRVLKVELDGLHKLFKNHQKVHKVKMAELQKKVGQKKHSAESWKQKHKNEKRQLETFETKYQGLEKSYATLSFCVKKVHSRLAREQKALEEWSGQYRDIKRRTLGLIDAVRDGDLQDLELNVIEELLKKPLPDIRAFYDLGKIVDHSEGGGDGFMRSSGKVRTSEEHDGDVHGVTVGGEGEEARPGTAGNDNEPPSPLFPPADEVTEDVYDSDPDRTTDDEDESDPEISRFSPIGRAMARGPGPETMDAFFPPAPLPPSSPSLERKGGNNKPGSNAVSPTITNPDKTPIKLESDSSENQLHDNAVKLGYYQFSRDVGDTLDVEEHPLLSSPSLTRNAASETLQQEQPVNENAATMPQEQDDETAAAITNEKPQSTNTNTRTTRSRQFGEPIVNSVRPNATQIKKEVDDEDVGTMLLSTVTPKPRRAKATPRTAPQPATKTSVPQDTPSSAKRKRTTKAQSTVKKRKTVRDVDIEAMAEDGAHEKTSQNISNKKKGVGQLSRLLQTPEASQGLILTPPSLQNNVGNRSARKHAEAENDDDDDDDDEPSTPRNNKRKGKPLLSDIISPSRFNIRADMNNGVGFAYHEGARTKASKECLPNCVKSCCRDFINGNMADMWGGIPEPVNKPLKFRDSPTKPKNKTADMAAFLKMKRNSSGRMSTGSVSTTKKQWEVDQVRREANLAYGKHKSAHSKQQEPLGFFNADFPTTQELEEQHKEADRRRMEMGWERERDAQKGGIWEKKKSR